jgi:hypothetical protein
MKRPSWILSLVLAAVGTTLGAASVVPAEGPLMDVARVYHTATALPDGTVLIVGGLNEKGVVGTAEILNPATNRVDLQIPLQEGRYGHVAALLRDGRVLIAGGINDVNQTTTAAEIYEPATKTFRRVGALAEARFEHTASMLPDGSVLIIGGRAGSILSKTCERFEPATEKFVADATLPQPRYGHTATILPDGRIVIVGGSTIYYQTQGSPAISGGNAEPVLVYTPSSHSFEPVGTLPRAQHAAALLGGNRVLIVGGNQPYNYTIDVLTGKAASAPFSGYIYGNTATTLRDGNVCVAGGYFNSTGFGAGGTVYSEALSLSTEFGTSLARAGHTATLLPDGSILLAGGVTASGITRRTTLLVYK